MSAASLPHAPHRHRRQPDGLRALLLGRFIVLEDFLSPGLVDALNASIDHFSEDRSKVRWQGAPGSTNGGGKRPWVVSPIAGDTRLKGHHDRGGITSPCDWPEPYCNPFRALGSHTRMLRYVLQMMGNGFRYTGVGAFFATKGTEGHVLHSGGTGTFGDEVRARSALCPVALSLISSYSTDR